MAIILCAEARDGAAKVPLSVWQVVVLPEQVSVQLRMELASRRALLANSRWRRPHCHCAARALASWLRPKSARLCAPFLVCGARARFSSTVGGMWGFCVVLCFLFTSEWLILNVGAPGLVALRD